MEVDMTRLQIHVGGNARHGLARFADAWRRAERGERLRVTDARLEFTAIGELLAALTPKRVEVIERVAHEPGLSIRALARGLKRDYKRVHGDVATLERLGLIERDARGVLHAPYDELVIHAQLKAAA
jgi:predicted transcriptional regulator